MTIVESPLRKPSDSIRDQIEFHSSSNGNAVGPTWALVVLTTINIVNLWHRNLVYNLSSVSAQQCTDFCMGQAFVPLCNLICEDDNDACKDCRDCRYTNNNEFYNMKEGTCISDGEYSTLVGVGFTIMFAIVGLFAGRLCDVWNRRRLHTMAIFMWSAATGAVGLCSNFYCVLSMRVLVSIGEAFNAPACYSLLAFYFPNRRSTANGIYSTGTYIGSGVSSLCILFAGYIGWRNTATFSGSFGIFVAVILYLTVEQPQSSVAPIRRSPPLSRVVRTLFTSFRVVLLLVTTSIRMIGTLVAASYLPLYFHRAFPTYMDQYSLINGTAVTACGVFSSILGGALADKWGKLDPGGMAWVPSVGIGLGLIPAFIALHCTNFYGSMAALLFQNLLAECWLGPGMAILQREVPRDMVGQSVAILLFFNILTANIGPSFIGSYDSGTDSVRRLIFLILAFSHSVSAILFWWLGASLQYGYQPDSLNERGQYELIRWICRWGQNHSKYLKKEDLEDETFLESPQASEGYGSTLYTLSESDFARFDSLLEHSGSRELD